MLRVAFAIALGKIWLIKGSNFNLVNTVKEIGCGEFLREIVQKARVGYRSFLAGKTHSVAVELIERLRRSLTTTSLHRTPPRIRFGRYPILGLRITLCVDRSQVIVNATEFLIRFSDASMRDL